MEKKAYCKRGAKSFKSEKKAHFKPIRTLPIFFLFDQQKKEKAPFRKMR